MPRFNFSLINLETELSVLNMVVYKFAYKCLQMGNLKLDSLILLLDFHLFIYLFLKLAITVHFYARLQHIFSVENLQNGKNELM